MKTNVTSKIAEEAIRIRLSQIFINEDYKAGKFKVPIHLSFGHEAIAVAVSNVLKEEDKLVLTHRNMAYNLVRAQRLKPILDEYYMKETGLAGGKLGSMNLINPKKNIIYSSSILGNNFPVSVGIAMSEKIRNENGVIFVLGGDGSIEEGSFYESLVMMKSMGVRVVVIIENNEWSLGTHISERRAPIELGKLTDSIDIPYVRLEGNNIDEYIKKLEDLRERTFITNQPVCVEVILKTLGDKRHPPTPEFPGGKYINYHAGPTTAVDIEKHFPGGIINESADDPIFVLSQKLGKENFTKISNDVFNELKNELV